MPDEKLSQVALDEIESGCQMVLSKRMIAKANIDLELDRRIGGMIANAFIVQLGQRFDPIHVEYPTDWWQALKQRWFPAAVLRRWPVHMTVKDWHPSVVYPQIALPDEPRTELLNFRQSTREDAS